MLGHMVDALVIAAVVLVNAIVGFVQEGKAERALGAIRDMIAPHATVLRDGARRTIAVRSEEHTSELQSLMRISYAVFCLKKKKIKPQHKNSTTANKDTNLRRGLI